MTKRFPTYESATPSPRLSHDAVGAIGGVVEGEVCQVTAQGVYGTEWSCDRPRGHDDGSSDALHHDAESDDLWRASRWTGHPLVIDKAKRRARLARILRMPE